MFRLSLMFFSELVRREDCEQKRPGPVISPAATRSVSLLLVVVTRHGSLQSLRQLLRGQVVRLAGDVAIAGHVAVAVILDVAADDLVEWREGGDVGVRFGVYYRDLQSLLLSSSELYRLLGIYQGLYNQ